MGWGTRVLIDLPLAGLASRGICLLYLRYLSSSFSWNIFTYWSTCIDTPVVFIFLSNLARINVNVRVLPLDAEILRLMIVDFFLDIIFHHIRSPSSSQKAAINSKMPTSTEHDTVYVRAKFNYTSDGEKTVINLRKGESIRVLAKLESGWWDGLTTEGKRGWFPSNYCEPCKTPRDLEGAILSKL